MFYFAQKKYQMNLAETEGVSLLVCNVMVVCNVAVVHCMLMDSWSAFAIGWQKPR
jgi:hypothetical protein